ncbi:DNA-3-methyladenine glycosylase 2 family protein [Ramlibacter henchirensis]|uniref:DNA-3-methyladenine glycosylase II n=1 Tax=Ramlibacter henchirensis TaxID=204072 RepID=A0A4Z0C6A2_9BURK|nr:DNA-3-methyladenine glycosylase 2 family protein [Ramlibacter henchirensis]TFZ05990.1 DNA-3-methyladenine glycosylase 2 family protein [Ramlibacter henchirensis]
MPLDADTLQPDACYLALKARDARFDGCFFTGVTSTGIYCRPVCRVRTPKRENCRFFPHAAQAERAGFRPCLRCRPELAPDAQSWSMQDAASILARQAARLLDEPEAWTQDAPSVESLAARLGVSERHLRRIFEAQFGVSPLQYLQTRRLLTAKQLLADTALPITQVALASGFGSLRRFNAAFVQHYGLSPTRLRREGTARDGEAMQVRLGYRPPYDTAAMLAFFRQRAIAGLECVDAGTFARTLELHAGGQRHAGWVEAAFDTERHQLVLRVSDSLHEALPVVIRRVRAAFDLDCDPLAVNGVLHEAFPGCEGLRVPGAFGGWELAVRAVLGQQITVAAARTLAQRLVERFGAPIQTRHPALHRLFPAPEALAQAEGDALGSLGIVRQRQAAIVALARAVQAGGLQLHAGANVQATVDALKQLPGIGDWTAQYIAMRALRWPDAFPAGDVALQKALGVQKARQPAREAEAASQAWKPWRSYAVIRAWAGLGATNEALPPVERTANEVPA